MYELDLDVGVQQQKSWDFNRYVGKLVFTFELWRPMMQKASAVDDDGHPW